MQLPRPIYMEMIAQALDELPNESCALLAGESGSDRVRRFYPCRNAAGSAKVYSVDAGDHLRASRDAEDGGLDLIGVVHSHTHTDPYPSPTDVQAAIDPEWHYLIVSLRFDEPSLRAFRIVDQVITEEPIELVDE